MPDNPKVGDRYVIPGSALPGVVRGRPGPGPVPSPTTATYYPRGTVALVNTGPDTNGSQFFFVIGDGALPPAYTPFGTVTGGLDVLDKVAMGGDDRSYALQPGGGRPNTKLIFQSVTVSVG
jgi:peptidyl-prolyl cis-trans isomerase B (cyclophilin B)